MAAGSYLGGLQGRLDWRLVDFTRQADRTRDTATGVPISLVDTAYAPNTGLHQLGGSPLLSSCMLPMLCRYNAGTSGMRACSGSSHVHCMHQQQTQTRLVSTWSQCLQARLRTHARSCRSCLGVLQGFWC